MICLRPDRHRVKRERNHLLDERARLRARLSEVEAKLVTLGHITGLTRGELLALAEEGA